MKDHLLLTGISYITSNATLENIYWQYIGNVLCHEALLNGIYIVF